MQRITNSMMTSRYLSNMKRNLNNMSTLQNQLASGKEILRTSQNPFVATRNKQLANQISENKQYNSNIKDASNWLDTTDTALSQAGNVMARIKELMVKAGNGAYSEDEIATINNEVVEKSKELGQILNTTFDGAYIFGGTKGTSKPVTVDANGNISYADKDGNAISKIEITTPASTNINVNYDSANKITITDGGGNSKIITSISQESSNSNIINFKIDGDTTTYSFDKTSTTPISVNIPAGGTDAYTITIDDITSMKNSITGANNAINQIGSDLKIEISDGVVVDYNKTVSDILQYTDSKLGDVNVMDEINNLISHLGTLSDKTASEDEKTVAKDYINGDGLTKMDSIVQNLLANRSQVGTLQNRMESAEETNEDQNYNMTDILSGSEDIDFTEKTMEYSVMQTVYTASLQVSSKVLTNTIMDYI